MAWRLITLHQLTHRFTNQFWYAGAIKGLVRFSEVGRRPTSLKLTKPFGAGHEPVSDRSTNRFPHRSTNRFPHRSTNQFPHRPTNRFPHRSTNRFPHRPTNQFPKGVWNNSRPSIIFDPITLLPENTSTRWYSTTRADTGGKGAFSGGGDRPPLNVVPP